MADVKLVSTLIVLIHILGGQGLSPKSRLSSLFVLLKNGLYCSLREIAMG